jgi:membrane protein YdbS with pleckstrin-like domain
MSNDRAGTDRIMVDAAPPVDGAGATSEVTWRHLDAAVIGMWRLKSVLWGAAVTLPLLAFAAALARLTLWWPYAAAAAPLVVGIGVAVRMPPRRYAAWGFRLEQDLLVVRHGVMVRVESTVPYSRVQHVDLTQGLLARRFRLADVVVHTASADGHVVRIPGLRYEDAVAVREELAVRTGRFDPL